MIPATILTGDEIRRIEEATLPDPFMLLGMHPLGPEHGNRLEIRVFCPPAAGIGIRAEEGSLLAMKRVTDSGLFVWASRNAADPFPYTLVIRTADGGWEMPDPYSFLPQLGELDLHLLAEGNHYRLYERLGARLWTAGKTRGVLFSVWAPNAAAVSVISSFNDWDRRRHPMRTRGSSGVWELFVPGAAPGDLYKYSILSTGGSLLEKSDPLGLAMEFRPRTASVVADIDSFQWTDQEWMEARRGRDHRTSPLSIYEMHAGSWRGTSDWRDFTSWEELADQLIPYLTESGFTHVELMPVMEHPFDGSWGYQTLGYFAPTSRLGSPRDFQGFVDRLHGASIGVILDWAPAHFPSDPSGLAYFDGTCLYEHQDPRMGRHPDWDTLVFNYDRREVRNFLVASGLFWLDRYHIDGLRVDAVASMLYLDYSRNEGEWVPNVHGGRENLGAIEFLKTLNSIASRDFPGAMTIAEESTSWPGVTAPLDKGGLGFTFKWNMGWMHDTLSFFSREPVHRKHHLDDLTFSLLYAFSERFILPFSHDEVVHGKASLIGKCPGDRWQKFANLRLLLAYQWCHPGKQLLFMGSEFGQWREWDHDSELDWELLRYGEHSGLRLLVGDLNRLLASDPVFSGSDCDPSGFRWIDFSDTLSTVVSFLRFSSGGDHAVCVFNMTPVVREGYTLGVPGPGSYSEVLNTDSESYGGSGSGNLGRVDSREQGMHGLPCSVSLTLPPLAALVLRPERR
ncbi:MAG: glycogen-branching enzyme [Candidatus Aegiribacteria sp. MLS_C]|nr:MAG: glycogen-branching enzyme [Candidatus Aegiribacteria sp. MLS_C]